VQDEFYTIKEVATLIKVTDQCVALWVKNGKLKAIKIGRNVRISKQEVENLLKGD